VNILVDENIPRPSVQALRDLDHDVLDLRGTPEEGLSDEELWLRAQRERRLLVTTDAGFADHRFESHYGILVVRLRQPNRERIHARVMWAIAEIDEHDWPGLLVTMRDNVRGLWRKPVEPEAGE
jgi:predicted nuclease of predicted toxin-antitoxin system